MDHRALRRELERVRDAIAEIRETARSTDGAVTVTVGGRGELLDLVVDRRSRHATAAVLADRVLATSRLAVARVGDRLRGVS
ncbi:MAG: YbaB/EbfC family nucleoid-associated protein [Saccharothrix sp.]|nr:YbaB/EbfC family nucleoid-associated protein [Saccharothrix sp.]